FSDNCPSANRMNTDFILSARLTARLTLICVLGVVAENRSDGVGKHERGTAWRVELAVVVTLDYLDVEIAPEHFRRLLCELYQQIDSDRHIPREEHRYLL